MTLTEAAEHVGDIVVYDDGYGKRQDGTIVKVGQQFVYVRFGHNDISIQATVPEHLSLLGSEL